MRPHYTDLGDLIHQAFREGRTVTLEKADGYGFQICVDGVAITDEGRGEGLPWESFGYPIDKINPSREAQAKIDELREGLIGHRARRQNESVETDAHAASEGADSP